MSVWDPVVIQLTMNYSSNEAELIHISGVTIAFIVVLGLICSIQDGDIVDAMGH